VSWSDESALNMDGLSSSSHVWVTCLAGNENLKDCLVPIFKTIETILDWECFEERKKCRLMFWDKEQ